MFILFWYLEFWKVQWAMEEKVMPFLKIYLLAGETVSLEN